jgi:tetratricopeptide (TPR) repeat protein
MLRSTAVVERYEQALQFYSQHRISESADHLMVAICLTRLERYPEARRFYRLSIHSSFTDRFWHDTSRPDWLVDTYMLAGEPSVYPQVLQEVEDYKLDPRGDSLYAFYAYAVTYLAAGRDRDAGACVPKLLARPKLKETYAMGRAIEAAIQRDQSAFDTALDLVLQAHRGMAKFGGLRWSAEGFLCLQAMSLAKIALQRGLSVGTQSEYLSRGYLDYLAGSLGCQPGSDLG